MVKAKKKIGRNNIWPLGIVNWTLPTKNLGVKKSINDIKKKDKSKYSKEFVDQHSAK